MPKSKKQREDECRRRQKDLNNPRSDRWLLVFNPWYQNALRAKSHLGQHQLEDIARWLCLCFRCGFGKVNTILHMSHRNFVIAKVDYTVSNEILQSKLGEYRWTDFLKSPSSEERGQCTKLFQYNYVEFGDPSDKQWIIYHTESEKVLPKGFRVLYDAPFIPTWCSKPSNPEAALWCHPLPVPQEVPVAGSSHRDPRLAENRSTQRPAHTFQSQDDHLPDSGSGLGQGSTTPATNREPPHVVRLMSQPPLYHSLGRNPAVVEGAMNTHSAHSFQFYKPPSNFAPIGTHPSTVSSLDTGNSLHQDSYQSHSDFGTKPEPDANDASQALLKIDSEFEKKIKGEENEGKFVVGKSEDTKIELKSEDTKPGFKDEKTDGEIIRIRNPYGVKWPRARGVTPDLSGMWDWLQLVVGDVVTLYANTEGQELIARLVPHTTLPGIIGQHFWREILVKCPHEWRHEMSTILSAAEQEITNDLIKILLPDSPPTEDYTSFVQPYPTPYHLPEKLNKRNDFSTPLGETPSQTQGGEKKRPASEIEDAKYSKRVR